VVYAGEVLEPGNGDVGVRPAPHHQRVFFCCFAVGQTKAAADLLVGALKARGLAARAVSRDDTASPDMVAAVAILGVAPLHAPLSPGSGGGYGSDSGGNNKSSYGSGGSEAPRDANLEALFAAASKVQLPGVPAVNPEALRRLASNNGGAPPPSPPTALRRAATASTGGNGGLVMRTVGIDYYNMKTGRSGSGSVTTNDPDAVSYDVRKRDAWCLRIAKQKVRVIVHAPECCDSGDL